MKKFIISLISTFLLCATILPSISFAQEINEGSGNENYEYPEGLDNTLPIDKIGDGEEAVQQFWVGRIFRVVLQAGKYISSMNRTGKVIKTARNVVATEAHIFSKKHLDGGILRLGKDRQQIVDRGIDIISKNDDNGKLKQGHNQIWTNINNQPAEVRCFVSKDGQIESFDIFFRAVSTPKPGANLIID